MLCVVLHINRIFDFYLRFLLSFVALLPFSYFYQPLFSAIFFLLVVLFRVCVLNACLFGCQPPFFSLSLAELQCFTLICKMYMHYTRTYPNKAGERKNRDQRECGNVYKLYHRI